MRKLNAMAAENSASVRSAVGDHSCDEPGLTELLTKRFYRSNVRIDYQYLLLGIDNRHDTRAIKDRELYTMLTLL